MNFNYFNILLAAIISWNGVIATTTPRMTATYSLDREPTTLYNTMLMNSFDSILGAGRSVSATSREKWRNTITIEIYRKEKDKLKNLFHSKMVC